ncbi:MAG: tetraacyldisaccharide 4'-kinase [Deltaproteobacteria bacterium]|nr:tetraacyldisaccharide 4'-kinase [Deltaproteobacteria bacterium]
MIKTWTADDPETLASSLLKRILYLLSLPYRLLVEVRNSLYDRSVLKQKHLPCKVISVGNITVGGTGKTPMTILLAKLLKDAGFRPAILSRGYRGKNSSGVNVVSDGQRVLMNADEGGDEPLLIAHTCPDIPVITGPKRHLTGRFAVEHFGVDILVLDDGFQHRRLFRDIDIVLVDAQRPFGNGFLLPRGPLRETKTALRRADIIVKTEVEASTAVTQNGRCLRPDNHIRDVFRGQREPREFIERKSGQSLLPVDWRDKKVCAFAGIAVPDSFKKTLEKIGVDVTAWLTFPDHHRYTYNDIKEIKRLARQADVDAVVTTEKDGVKLSGYPEFLADIYLLKIEMTISPSQDMLKAAILDKLRTHKE